jgi:hypothetical protein
MTTCMDAGGVTRRQRAAAARLEKRVERFLNSPDARKALASGLPGTAETLRRYLSALKGQSPLPRNLDSPTDGRNEVKDRIENLMRGIEASIELRRVMRTPLIRLREMSPAS